MVLSEACHDRQASHVMLQSAEGCKVWKFGNVEEGNLLDELLGVGA